MGRNFYSWLAAQVTLYVGNATALSSANTSCCAILENAGLSAGLLFPNSTQYTARVDSYWSETAQLTPWCIYQPQDVYDVSKAVVALAATKNQSTQCQFAVRSGGHTTWAGSNNIENGVTIDLGLMNSTTYHEDNQIASVLPGARWGAVYETLDPLNRGVAGGRAATVGVGGFLIGGGNNFYAPLKGLATDNVAQFEVVLTNGSIVYANNETNTDLFQALKGGSANFGIVTRYDLITWDAPGLWGGVVTYPNSTADQQLKAFKNFSDSIANDPYATAITIFQFSSTTNQTIVINAYDYAKPVANAPAFDQYLAIPGNTSDSMRITNMTDLVTELDQASGFRDLFVTNTWVNDIRVLEKAVEIHNDLSGKIWADNPIGNWVLQDMVQPIPPLFAKHGVELGGDVMGLDRFENETLVLFQTYLAWTDASQDAMFEGYGTSYIQELDSYAASIGKSNPWVYLNYAYETQDPLKGYGEANLAKIRAAAKKYDPKGILQELAPGGFKVSKA